PVLERPGPDGAWVAQRDEALAQVAGGRDTERLPQAAARPSVVGDAHDGGDGAGVLAGGQQAGGQPVPAADGDDCRVPQRPMSRWFTVGLKPYRSMTSAISLARTTLRCMPPVHPTAMVK